MTLMNLSIDADNNLRKLALALARNDVGAALSPEEVLLAEGLDINFFYAVKDNPTFKRYHAAYTKELVDSGFSFAAKCRVLAEDLLKTTYKMAVDEKTPSHARVKIIENLVRWGDLEPKQSMQMQAGPGFQITINIPGANTITAGSGPTALRAADVVDADTRRTAQAPQITLPHTPPAVSKKTSRIMFDEAPSTVYAGDDVW